MKYRIKYTINDVKSVISLIIETTREWPRISQIISQLAPLHEIKQPQLFYPTLHLGAFPFNLNHNTSKKLS